MKCFKCNRELTTGDINGLCFKCKDEEKQISIGWMCLRCGTIHSPYSLKCDCTPPSKNTSTLIC